MADKAQKAGKSPVVMFEIDKTITVTHYPEQKAMLATWHSLCTTQFREALERGLDACGRVGAKSWIVDLRLDPGVPSQDDQRWIETDTPEITIRNAVSAVINLHGKSALATMGSRRWSKSASERGMSTFDCASLEDALEIAAEVAVGKHGK